MCCCRICTICLWNLNVCMLNDYSYLSMKSDLYLLNDQSWFSVKSECVPVKVQSCLSVESECVFVKGSVLFVRGMFVRCPYRIWMCVCEKHLVTKCYICLYSKDFSSIKAKYWKWSMGRGNSNIITVCIVNCVFVII